MLPSEVSSEILGRETPDRFSPYGLNVEKSGIAAPADDGNSDRYTFTSLGMPGPDPTMTLSTVVPSICAAATVTPPRAAAANAWKRASSVPKAPLPPLTAPV